MTLSSLVKLFFLNYIKDQVCYPPYGCFDKSPPYNLSYIPLPADPKHIDTKFLLHARNSDGLNLNGLLDNRNPIPDVFVDKKKLIVLTHGFLEHGSISWIPEMTKELLAKEDVNIIVVNWKKAARFPYHQAVANIRIVGSQISYLLENLINQTSLEPENIHLIGFSLGAHLMGNVGRKLKRKSNNIGRITGLDPAGPYFEKTSKDFRLDSTDALYVDAIHTETKTTPLYSIGIPENSGHTDYYPNGGYDQPGCEKASLEMLSTGDMYHMVSCSHYRAVHFFIRSIQDKDAFQSFACNSYEDFQSGECSNIKTTSHVGYFSDRQPGTFYFLTSAKPPFSGFHYHIEIVTGGKLFSDTFGIVQLKMIGEHAATELIPVKWSSFETNSRKKLVMFSAKNLGEIYQIEVVHGSGLFLRDDWFVKHIKIQPLDDSRRKYVGCINNWIGDRSINVDMDPIDDRETSLCRN